MKQNTRKLTALALTISFALILSYIESRIPGFAAIPGVKIGLANIAVIFTLYKFGTKEAVLVSILRILLVSMMFGNPVSMIYSVSGAVLSLGSMIVLKRLTSLREVAISVVGGVMHNVGQIATASLMISTNLINYYLPFLILSGTIAGIAVGVASALLIQRIRLKMK